MKALKTVWLLVGLAAGGAIAQDLSVLNRELQACSVQIHVLPQVDAEPPPSTPAQKQSAELMRRFGLPAQRARRAQLFEQPRGLGLIWSDGRHVLSLAHLLGGDKPAALAVETESGQRVVADSLGSDAISGAWLLRLRETLPNPPCRFGSARSLQLGQELLGIGNLRTVARSLQRGIVAGLGREGGDSLGEPLIQTDFRSAPGMAGGPLFDLQGRVVGLHDMMLSSGSQDLAALARPIDDLLAGAQALKAGQLRRPSRIGIQMGEAQLEEESAESRWKRWLAGAPAGVAVLEVEPQGPAGRAGLRAGDRILGLDGSAVTQEADLARRVARLPTGVAVRLRLQRDGHPIEVTLIPEAGRPAP